MNHLNLFLGKIWQSKSSSLCFQIKDPNFEKKVFLILDTKSKARALSLSSEKIKDLNPQGTIAAILRKHLEGKIITSLVQNSQEKTLWIGFTPRAPVENPTHYLRINVSDLVEASLVNHERKTLFRYTRQGTYTHIKEFEGVLPHENQNSFESLYPELLENFHSPQEPDQEDKEKNDPSPNRELKKLLRRRLKTLRSSLKKLQSSFLSAEALAREREKLDRLKENLYLLPSGAEKVVLKKEETGLEEDLFFKLDPQLSPGKNLSELFSKLRKKEKGLTHNEARLKALEKDIGNLEGHINSLEEEVLSPQDQESLLKDLSIKKQSPQSGAKINKEALPFKVFEDASKVTYLVGKSSKDNDSLVKKAKSHDLWLHATGIRGSHVIIPASSLKKKQDLEPVKRTGAILALYYSKAKEDRRGEVYLSKRQHLKKEKKAAPGLWTVQKSESLFVSYTEDELKEILDCMKS